MYRSDAAPAIVQPLPRDPVAAPAAPAYTAPARVEARLVAPAQPRRERGWLETGLIVMTLPVAFGLGLMFAPVVAPMVWMFGSRSRR